MSPWRKLDISEWGSWQGPTTTEHDCPQFEGQIHVHHSAVATFVTPSNLCGAGGLHQERIWSNPCFFSHPHCDTVFVILDEDMCGMDGMVIAWVLLFFSFKYQQHDYLCTFVVWFVTTDENPDEDTGMCTVQLEYDELVEHPTCPGYRHKLHCSWSSSVTHLWLFEGTQRFYSSWCIGPISVFLCKQVCRPSHIWISYWFSIIHSPFTVKYFTV